MQSKEFRQEVKLVQEIEGTNSLSKTGKRHKKPLNNNK